MVIYGAKVQIAIEIDETSLRVKGYEPS